MRRTSAEQSSIVSHYARSSARWDYLAVSGVEHVQQRLHVSVRVVHVHLLERDLLVRAAARVESEGRRAKNMELPVRQTLHLLHHQIDVMPVALFTLRGIC